MGVWSRLCGSLCGIITLLVLGTILYSLLPGPNHDLLEAIKSDDLVLVRHLLPMKIKEATRVSLAAGVYRRATIDDVHFGSGMTCMHAAAMRNAFDVIKWMIEQGATVDIIKENDGRTPLHMAATYSNVTMVQLLLDHGAVVDQKGVNDWTPLLLAVLFSNTDTVELLLSRGASATDRVLDGQSALLLAMNYAPPKVQRMLIAHGATLEPTDYYYDEYMHACADIEKHNDWVVPSSSSSSSGSDGKGVPERRRHQLHAQYMDSDEL